MLAIFLAVLLLAVPAVADESAGFGQSTAEASHFHLVTFKCESDLDEGAQTTPQSPPLDVDDPGTPGCNSWEINITFDGDLTAAQNNWELPLLDMNYGIGDNLQLKWEVPFLSQQTGGSTSSALGESLAGIKYEFYDNEVTGTSVAIYPQVSVLADAASALSQGLVTPGTITTVPLLMTTHIGRTAGGMIDLTADLGYNFSSKSDTTDFLSASIGLGAPLMRKIGIMGEMVTEQAFTKDDTGTRQQLLKADIGLMETFSKHVLFYQAVGHSLIASDQMDHAYMVTGFQLLTNGGT